MRGEPTMQELQGLAARQRLQLDNQARLIAAREQRLRQVQEGVNGIAVANDATTGSSSQADRVRKLREKVEAQEAKLRKLRALRGQVDQQRITNSSLSADLSSIKALFNEKEKELSVAAAQVEELTLQLEQYSSQNQNAQAHPGTKAYFVQLHLERLRAELLYRNKLNEQKSAELNEKKKRLIDNRENVGDLELRINELRERLQRKKLLNQQLATQLSDASQKNNKILTSQQQQQQQQQQRHFKTQTSQVAAVEPFNRQQQSDSRDDDVTDFTANKQDAKYRTLPYNTHFVPIVFNTISANRSNQNNNNNNISSTLMKSLKVASVPPQIAERPALPPKPALNFKPLLPPRQNSEKDLTGDTSPLPTTEDKIDEILPAASLLAKSELPLKPKPLTLKKHSIPPPLPVNGPPCEPYPEQLEQQQQQLEQWSHHEDDPAVNKGDRDMVKVEQVSNTTTAEPQNVDMVEETVSTAVTVEPEHDPKPDEAALRESVTDPGSEHVACEGVARRLRKGNLKSGIDSQRKYRRVSFDPLALLLDASLEGELELVKKTALEVSNPSAANDEGITALHNAICAGHLEIVRFLVELGCDVNAQDSDGWTPLHCAASCNNLAMVKFLVEHGACIFAATLSDQETAAEKCEEDEEGFDGCSEYLYSIQEKLGILNAGKVFAVYGYEAQNADELSFQEGSELTVLRKGDDFEREWWWSRFNDQEGYVPRNLLGLCPRTSRKEPE